MTPENKFEPDILNTLQDSAANIPVIMLTHCNFGFPGQSQRLNEKGEELIDQCSDVQFDLTVGSDEGIARTRISDDLISVQSSVEKLQNTRPWSILHLLQKFITDRLHSTIRLSLIMFFAGSDNSSKPKVSDTYLRSYMCEKKAEFSSYPYNSNAIIQNLELSKRVKGRKVTFHWSILLVPIVAHITWEHSVSTYCCTHLIGAFC